MSLSPLALDLLRAVTDAASMRDLDVITGRLADVHDERGVQLLQLALEGRRPEFTPKPPRSLDVQPRPFRQRCTASLCRCRRCGTPGVGTPHAYDPTQPKSVRKFSVPRPGSRPVPNLNHGAPASCAS